MEGEGGEKRDVDEHFPYCWTGRCNPAEGHEVGVEEQEKR